MPIHLPPPSDTIHLPPSASADPPSDHRHALAALGHHWECTRLARVALLSGVTIALGALILRLLWPLLPADRLSAVCRAHIEPLYRGGMAPLLVWLCLLAQRFPHLLLIAASGLTRFSGGLTSAVLSLGGLSDGAALYLLYRLWCGAALPESSALPSDPAAWLAIFAASVLLRTLWRTCLAAEARRLVATLSPLPGTEASDTAAALTAPHLRRLFWRYASVCLAALGGLMVTEGLYVALLLLLK